MAFLNWPNRISATRIVLLVPFVICLLNLNSGWSGWRYVALGLFGVMAVSDALDGFLARTLQQQTVLGSYLDPLGDKLLIASSMVLLATESTAVPNFKLPGWVAVVAIGKDVLTVAGFGLVYLTTRKFVVQPRLWGKLCTMLQLVMLCYVLVGPDLPGMLAGLLPALYWSASALAVLALADYLRMGSRAAADVPADHV